MIHIAIWDCFLAINKILFVGLWQCVKHGSPFHSRVKLAVNWVVYSRWKLSKTSKSATVSWESHGIIFLGCAWYILHWPPWKRKSINGDYHIKLFVRLNYEIAKKQPHMKKRKILFHQDNAPCHRSAKTMAKLNELGFNLLPHPPYSPNLAPSDYCLFADLKKMPHGKRFGSNVEVTAATEANFVAKNKLFSKHGIRKLAKCWNDCIALEGNYVNE